jgi:hypothetical protein
VSARPDLARLPDSELDLLVSRAIDGDLSPEEEQELAAYLAAHPDARARYARMEEVVARLQKLPAPEPPFALATRVSSQVAERSRGLGAVSHRFGFYPPPGLVAAGIGLLALGGILASLFTAPKRADRVAAIQKKEGPVHVFFQDAPPTVPVPAAGTARVQTAGVSSEAESVIAAEVKAFDKKLEGMGAQAKAKDEANQSSANAGDVRRRDEVRIASADTAQPAPPFAPEAPAAAEKTSVGERAAPAPAAPAAEPRVALRQARPSEGRLADAEAETRRERGAAPEPAAFSVALTKGAGWRLTPPPPPPAGVRPVDASFRLAVDAAGHVVRVLREDGRAVAPELERFLVTLTFERRAGAAASEVEVRVILR